MLPQLEIRRNRPYEVREVEVEAEAAAALPIYGPYFNVFGKPGLPIFRDPMTWSAACLEAARLNEA